MEAYAQALNYGIPFFVVLIAVEAIYARFFAGEQIRSMDTISSLSSGLTNIIKDVLGLTVFIITYDFVFRHTAFLDIEATWPVFALTFIYKDFAGYWKHRLEHEINYFWNHHIIHHSSEEYNLPCALRQSISEVVSISIFFLFPLALLGVPTTVLAVVAPVHLFAQFWYHTRHIGRMGFLESFLVTPSHHRVHHAINPEYIDKNYSQIFIVWDKLFGTFQPELDEVPPVYGVKRAVRTWNPFLINFQHLWLIVQDGWRTSRIADKFRVWFMPTGWRPDDVASRYPVEVIDDVYTQEKYDTNPSNLLTGWSWVQLLTTLGMMLFLFNNLASIGRPDIFLFGAFLLASVFSYTALMDKRAYALPVEWLRGGFGLAVVALSGDFYSFGALTGLPVWLPVLYFVTGMGLAAWFVLVEFRRGGEVRLSVS